jgi:hypothetical protein
MSEDNLRQSEDEIIRSMINDCIHANNIEFIVQLILQLKKNYVDLAKLSTFGYYNKDWTHEQVMNYVTYEA